MNLSATMFIFSFISDTCNTAIPSAGWSRGDIIALIGVSLPVLIIVLGLFFRAGSITTTIKNISADVAEIKKEVKKIPHLEGKIEGLMVQKVSVSQSPIQLNGYGLKILADSHIGHIIEPYIKEITNTVRNNKPETVLQAQNQIFEAFKTLKSRPEIKNAIETAAFNAGSDVETLLLVAAIDSRDNILKELGYDGKEIDNTTLLTPSS